MGGTQRPFRILNRPRGRADEKAIRRAATAYQIPCITTLSGAAASVNGIRALQREMRSLQEYHGTTRETAQRLR